MERKKASDYPQELLDLFHEYQHGDIDRRTFLERAGKFAVGGLTAAAILAEMKPELRLGAAGAEGRSADQDRGRDGAVAAGQRQHQGRVRQAGEDERQAARDHRDPREPRPEPVRRGRRAPLRRRQLHRLRAGRPDLGRRLPGQRRAGRGQVPRGQRAEDDGGLRRLGELAAHQPGVHRQDRRDRLLLRRRHRQPAGGAARQGSRRRRAVLRPAAGRGRRAEDHGADPGALRRSEDRHRRRHRHRTVRGGDEGERQEARGLHLRRRAAWFPQRHHAALRREGGQARDRALHGVLQQEPPRRGPRYT